MTHQKEMNNNSIGARIRKTLTPYLLLLPAFLVLGYILVYPAIYNGYLSLFDWRLTSPDNRYFIGLENYIRILTEDSTFYNVIGFTFLFAGCTLAAEMVVGLAIALLLNNNIRGRSFISALYILPYAMAPIAVGLCWRLMWAEDYGIVNYVLSLLGFGKVSWLVDKAVLSVVIPEAWRSVPFVTLMLLAGLTSIPNDLYEAARVDGASVFHRFAHITLPLLMPSLTIVLVFETVFKLRVFDLIFALTGGGPGSQTLPIGVYIHRTYFRYMEGGYAAALSVILLLIGGVISVAYIKLFYKDV